MAPKSGDFGYFSDCKMWRKNMNDDDDSYLKRLPPNITVAKPMFIGP